jgi:hypothetical protein
MRFVVEMREKAWSTLLVTIHKRPEKGHTPFLEVVGDQEIYNFPIHHLDHFSFKIMRKGQSNISTLKYFSRARAHAYAVRAHAEAANLPPVRGPHHRSCSPGRLTRSRAIGQCHVPRPHMLADAPHRAIGHPTAAC